MASYTTTARQKKTGVSAVVATAAASKDAASVASSSTGANGAQGAAPGVNWSTIDDSFIRTYHQSYQLKGPTAFRSAIGGAVLTVAGIGRQSPTTARRRDKRSTSRDHLVSAVRKHFNGLAVNETDVIVDFLYKVKNEDRQFRHRFSNLPPQKSR